MGTCHLQMDQGRHFSNVATPVQGPEAGASHGGTGLLSHGEGHGMGFTVLWSGQSPEERWEMVQLGRREARGGLPDDPVP